MKKIRVCFVSPKAYPLFNPDCQAVFGGAEVDLYLLATELAKDTKFEVCFVVADYGQPNEEVRENVRILKALNFRQNPIIGAHKIWKALKQADADWTMLETASPGVPLGLLFSRMYRRKLLYRTASQRECDGTYLKAHPVLGRLFIHSLKKADRVIAQNQHDRRNLKTRCGIDAIVIPNGHRIPDANPSNKDNVLWVGRSAAVKGPRRFLELARAFPQEPFVMICQKATGDENYDALCRQARKIENLTFLERVPFQQIDGYFEKARVFVNTSDSEGFPNTFIQACRAGTAVLSYQVNPDDFLNVHRCGLACGGDFEKLKDNLAFLLADNRYRELGRNGREYVRKNHDAAVIIETYKAIFMKDY